MYHVLRMPRLDQFFLTSVSHCQRNSKGKKNEAYDIQTHINIIHEPLANSVEHRWLPQIFLVLVRFPQAVVFLQISLSVSQQTLFSMCVTQR